MLNYLKYLIPVNLYYYLKIILKLLNHRTINSYFIKLNLLILIMNFYFLKKKSKTLNLFYFLINPNMLIYFIFVKKIAYHQFIN